MPPKIEVGWLPRTSGEDTTVAGTERGRALLGRLDTEEEEERPHGIGRGLAARVAEAASAGGLGRGSAGAGRPGAAEQHERQRQQDPGAAHEEYFSPSVNCSVTPIRSLNSLKGMYRSVKASTSSSRPTSARKRWIARTATKRVSTGNKITA